MTQEAGWISLGVVPTLDRSFSSKLSRDLDPTLSRVGRDSGHRFGSIMGKAAVVGAAAVIGAGFAAFRFGQDAVAQARDAQEVGATSVAILKSTEHAANLTKHAYDDLTASLMAKTAIDDDQIARGGNLLLTFKNVKREGKGLKDIFGRALAASLDLTAAGFGSIESTSKQLGKALNDPVKGISALSRAGVTFTADQQETIKSLVETGDLLGAQKIILKEVESQVGGTAEAQKTSAKELATAWGNLKEEIGGALLPVIDELADVMLEKGIPAGEKLSDWIRKDGIPQAREFARKLEPLAHEVLPAMANVLGDVKGALEKAAPFAEDLVSAFNDMPDWAKKAIVAGTLGTIVAKKTGILGSLGGKDGGSGLLGLATKARPIPVFVVNNGIDSPLGPKGPKGGSLTSKAATAAAVVSTAAIAAAAVTIGIRKFNNKFESDATQPSAQAGSGGTGAVPGSLDQAFPDDNPVNSFLNALLGKGGDGFKTQGLAKASKDLRGLLVEPIKDSDAWIDHVNAKTIQPKVDFIGMDEARAIVERFRLDASQPIHVPVIIDAAGNAHSGGGHSTNVPGEAPTTDRRAGVTVNIDKMVAHDYKDFQRQAQQRSQQAALGGIGVLAS